VTRLSGKVAVITGAGSSGNGLSIGRALAACFAEEGARVLVADVVDDWAAETVRLVNEAGGTAIAQVLTATAAGRMGATKASIAAFFIPVVALILGVVIRHERVTTMSLVGAAICLVGAAIVRNPQMLSGLHFREIGIILERSRGFRL